MQIPTEYGVKYIVLAVSVGLATIGVCVFGAAASVAALFICKKNRRVSLQIIKGKTPTLSKKLCKQRRTSYENIEGKISRKIESAQNGTLGCELYGYNKRRMHFRMCSIV